MIEQNGGGLGVGANALQQGTANCSVATSGLPPVFANTSLSRLYLPRSFTYAFSRAVSMLPWQGCIVGTETVVHKA